MTKTRKGKGGQAREPENRKAGCKPENRKAGCKWYKKKMGKAGGILIFTKAYVISQPQINIFAIPPQRTLKLMCYCLPCHIQ